MKDEDWGKNINGYGMKEKINFKAIFPKIILLGKVRIDVQTFSDEQKGQAIFLVYFILGPYPLVLRTTPDSVLRGHF